MLFSMLLNSFTTGCRCKTQATATVSSQQWEVDKMGKLITKNQLNSWENNMKITKMKKNTYNDFAPPEPLTIWRLEHDIDPKMHTEGY